MAEDHLHHLQQQQTQQPSGSCLLSPGPGGVHLLLLSLRSPGFPPPLGNVQPNLQGRALGQDVHVGSQLLVHDGPGRDRRGVSASPQLTVAIPLCCP